MGEEANPNKKEKQMDATMTSSPTTRTTTTIEIVPAATSDRIGQFFVRYNGVALTTEDGVVRYFASRNSARKTITRLRRPFGDRHR